VTAGNLLVLVLTSGAADTISSIADDKGNTWNLAVSVAASTRKTYIYYAMNAAAGATTVTVTYTAGQFPDTHYFIREYSGIATTSALDKTASNSNGTGYTDSHSTGTTAATTQANELVVAAVGSDANGDPTYTAPTGYADFESQGGQTYTWGACDDKIVSATGTQTATFGSTAYVNSQGAIATFKEAAAAGQPTAKRIATVPFLGGSLRQRNF
jgi:hypothetical protein